MSQKTYRTYHFDGVNITMTETGLIMSNDIPARPGWVCVVLDNGAVYLKTDKRGWERIKDARHTD